MPAFTLTALVPWIITHGYFLFYIISVIEGTITTVAAGVAAGFGYYSILIIILIAIAGDLTGDLIYYFIGYKSRSLILERHGSRFGLNKTRTEKIEKLVNKHFVKTMLVIKLSPIIPIPGLIAIGASHAPIKKYIWLSFLITAPRSIFFALLGFYSLKTYMYLTGIIYNSSYIVGGLVVLIIGIYFLYQKITSRITQKANVNI